MSCFHPLHGWKSRKLTKNGKRKIVFNRQFGYEDMPTVTKCGRCIGCKLDLSREWAIRCMHETDNSEDNCYITLTYAPEHLPPGGTLSKRDFQLFMKKLRKHYSWKYINQKTGRENTSYRKIRYYHSGEYGGKNTLRPHYHALLFNLDFKDLKFYKKINGIPLFTSETLTKIWGKGHCSVGRITIDSAAYVARYIMKKIYPDKRDDGAAHKENYTRVDTETGEIHEVDPEYSTMSKNIGIEWFKKYKSDIYPKDFLTFKGDKLKPPKAYDRLYDASNPKEMANIKKKRIKNMAKQAKNQTIQRLQTRERVKILQTARLIRELGEQP